MFKDGTEDDDEDEDDSRIDLDMLLPHASQTTHFERNETQGI